MIIVLLLLLFFVAPAVVIEIPPGHNKLFNSLESGSARYLNRP